MCFQLLYVFCLFAGREIHRSARWLQNRVNKVGSLWSNCILSFGSIYLLQTNKSMNNRSYVDSGLDHLNQGEIGLISFHMCN